MSYEELDGIRQEQFRNRILVQVPGPLGLRRTGGGSEEKLGLPFGQNGFSRT